MSPRSTVPDAWDDDWVNQADEPSEKNQTTAGKKTKISKAERRAQQAEFNRQLWEDADATRPSFVVDVRNDVSLRGDFQPAVKVLSRKPAPAMIVKKDPVSGMEQLSVDDEDEDDADGKKAPDLTPEERQQKAQREREEKQRKYDEARERLFGSSAQRGGLGSGPPSPAPGTPRGLRGRGRGRGGGEARSDDSRPGSSTGAKQRQLYDPSGHAKLDVGPGQKRPDSGRSTPAVEEQPIRQPKGPDGSGRGGHGFATRGRPQAGQVA